MEWNFSEESRLYSRARAQAQSKLIVNVIRTLQYDLGRKEKYE
jgi:hypothetical protein